MTLTAKEKELAAVGISIAAGCRPCTDYHLKAVRKTGATDTEIHHAVTTAAAVRKAAAGSMEAYGLAHLGLTAETAGPDGDGDVNRVGVLVSVGAALAVNCTTALKEHLAAAATVGITADEVGAIATLATFIREQAVSHVDKLVASYHPDPRLAQPEPVAAGCGCG